MKKLFYTTSRVVNIFKYHIRKIINYLLFRYRLNKAFKKDLCNIVIGSSGIYQNGWIPTDIEFINLLVEKDWKRYFKENSIDALLAEHVLEHITEEEAFLAATICFKFLKQQGGYIRVAVPDGLSPDKEYINSVKPGGTGYGSSDHKILYTYLTLSNIFKKAGFKVDLLEYFDEKGNFHYNEWNSDKGMIVRSKRFDERNSKNTIKYTSIILDAFKQ
jgi:predicted SAM-dependent methyltransferase